MPAAKMGKQRLRVAAVACGKGDAETLEDGNCCRGVAGIIGKHAARNKPLTAGACDVLGFRVRKKRQSGMHLPLC